MKGKDVVIVGGVTLIAYVLLKNQSQEQGGGSTGLSDLLGGGGGGGFDLTGLFSGLGDLLGGLGGEGGALDIGNLGGGLNDMFAGLGDMFSGITGGITGGLGGAGGGIGEGGVRGLINETGEQTKGILDSATDLLSKPFLAAGTGVSTAATGLGFGAKDIAKAAAIGGATYLGVKMLSPIASPLGKAIAGAIRTPISKSPMLSMGSGFINLLKSPVSKVPVLGTITMAAGAGYGGYKLGEVLMKHTPLGRITGQMAETAAVNVVKTPVIGQLLFPHATVKMSPTTQSNFQKKWGITTKQAAGMTTAQLQDILKKKKTTSFTPTVKATPMKTKYIGFY